MHMGIEVHAIIPPRLGLDWLRMTKPYAMPAALHIDGNSEHKMCRDFHTAAIREVQTSARVTAKHAPYHGSAASPKAFGS